MVAVFDVCAHLSIIKLITMQINKKNLTQQIVKLRKQVKEIRDNQHFCLEHKFEIEAKFFQKQAELIENIIMQFEVDFDLGYVSINH